MQPARYVSPGPGALPGTEPGAGFLKSFKALKLGRFFVVVRILLIFAVIAGVIGALVPKSTVQLGGETFRVDVARTEAEQAKGLSGRSHLGANEGMLFVFGKADYWPIWMQDMNFAIDLVWLDVNKQVINVQPNVSPATFPQAFLPKKPALYVLELPAGAADRAGIKDGQTAVLDLLP